MGQLHIIIKGQKILKSRAVNPFQNEVIIITQRGMYYRKGSFTTKLTRYFKLGQELSQSPAGDSLQSRSIIIAKCVRYYKVEQIYCKVRQLLRKRPVHLRDTRTNRDLCLLTEQMYFKNGVLYDVMPFRRLRSF